MSAVEEAAKVLARVLHAEVCGSGCAGGDEEVQAAHRQAEALAAAGLLPEGETRTEWAVRGVLPEPDPREVWRFHTETVARVTARHPKYGGTVVTRECTSYPDTVTPWTEVQP